MAEPEKGIWGELPMQDVRSLDAMIAIAVNQELAVVEDMMRGLRERIANLEHAVAHLKAERR